MVKKTFEILPCVGRPLGHSRSLYFGDSVLKEKKKISHQSKFLPSAVNFLESRDNSCLVLSPHDGGCAVYVSVTLFSLDRCRLAVYSPYLTIVVARWRLTPKPLYRIQAYWPSLSFV